MTLIHTSKWIMFILIFYNILKIPFVCDCMFLDKICVLLIKSKAVQMSPGMGGGIVIDVLSIVKCT